MDDKLDKGIEAILKNSITEIELRLDKYKRAYACITGKTLELETSKEPSKLSASDFNLIRKAFWHYMRTAGSWTMAEAMFPRIASMYPELKLSLNDVIAVMDSEARLGRLKKRVGPKETRYWIVSEE